MTGTSYNDDLSFLRNQVQRLNTVLAEYQNKYPPIGIVSQSAGVKDSEELPWMSDKHLMSPLLMEYDANIQAMQKQLDKYELEQKNLRLQVDKVVAENDRLTKQLREVVDNQMQSGAPVAMQLTEDSPTLGEDLVMQNLQQQLDMAIKEKDSIMEMWQASVSEIDRLEKSIQEQQFNPRLNGLEHQANQIKEQYVMTVAELTNEVQTLQQELDIARKELKISQNQSTELRKTLEEMRKQVRIQQREISSAEDDKNKIQSQSNMLKQKTVSSDTHAHQMQNELLQYRQDNVNLERKLQSVQQKFDDMEQKLYESSLKSRELQQKTDSAVMDRDQAAMKEKLAVQEISRLQAALSALVDEAGARTRQEVDSVWQHCNQQIENLTEQIHQLELDRSERQHQLDRAVREKRAAESELEKIYQEGMLKSHKDKSSYDDLNRRACDAERLRDEAQVKLDGIQNELKRLELGLKQEKNHLESEVISLKDRLTSMNQEFDLVNNDRVRLTERVDELEKQSTKLQRERDATNRNYTKDVTCLEKAKLLKEKEYKVSLKATEDNHRETMMELRRMLDSQQRMSAKWKEECQTIASKFESKLDTFRQEIKREKQRNTELTKLLHNKENSIDNYF